MRLINEGQLVYRLKEGDEAAFVELYNAYGEILYSFLIKLNIAGENIHDVIQQTFIKLWENRAALNPQLSLQSYLITIAKNDIRNMIKKRIREKQYNSTQPADIPQTKDIQAIELKNLLDIILQYLPAKRREVFSLSRIQGYSNDEIAILLNISKKTVENHINHSSNQLKGIIKKLNGQQ